MKTPLILLLVLFGFARITGAEKPNVVIMVADDHRFDALGVVQEERGENANFPFFKSPHLDRLAAGGTRFRNAFVVHSLCSPSRATVLSGQHTHQHGISGNEMPYESRDTWPHVLLENGWTTGYFGKWHMGDQRERPGFKESATFLNQGIYHDCPFLIDGKPTQSRGWVDDVSTTHAIEFMTRNRDKPFALYLGFKAPHDKRSPPTRHKRTYAEATITKPASWNKPAPWRETAGQDWDRQLADRRAYFGTLAGVDDNVGRVLDTLDDLGIAGRTLVIYMGDNGYYLGEHGLGDKRTAYEESMRIPFLLRYPNVVRPGARDELVLNLDVASTILDACGLQPGWSQHGRSLLSLLQAEPGGSDWRGSFLYQNYRDPAYPVVTFDVLAVRTVRHKYVENNGNAEWAQLFDLETDPGEMHNLAREPAAAELRERMRAELEKLKAESGYRDPVVPSGS